MCQNSLTGKIVQNVVEIIILFAFFPTMASKYVYQLSENTLFLSVLDILRLRDFQEIKISFVFVRTVGSSLY